MRGFMIEIPIKLPMVRIEGYKLMISDVDIWCCVLAAFQNYSHFKQMDAEIHTGQNKKRKNYTTSNQDEIRHTITIITTTVIKVEDVLS